MVSPFLDATRAIRQGDLKDRIDKTENCSERNQKDKYSVRSWPNGYEAHNWAFVIEKITDCSLIDLLGWSEMSSKSSISMIFYRLQACLGFLRYETPARKLAGRLVFGENQVEAKWCPSLTSWGWWNAHKEASSICESDQVEGFACPNTAPALQRS